MRRRAALVAFLLIIPFAAHSASSPQLVLQLGGTGRAGENVSQPTMMMNCVDASFSAGGGWLEFGVLGRERPQSFVMGLASPSASGAILSSDRGEREDEIIEIATGFVVGPTGSNTFYPYVKAGLGAYHDRGPEPPRIYLDSAYSPLFGSDPRGDMKWDAGMSFGVGARVGPPGGLAAAFEARLHVTRLNGDDFYQLLSVTGGLWFR